MDFRNPFSLDGYIALPGYSREGLGPSSNNMVDLIDSPHGNLYLLWGVGEMCGAEVKGTGWEEGVGTGIGI